MTDRVSTQAEDAIRQAVICNTRGLHARAAAKFVETTRQFEAIVHISKDGEKVSADSIMDLLMLAASKGTHIKIYARGTDAEKAADALTLLVESGFHEED